MKTFANFQLKIVSLATFFSIMGLLIFFILHTIEITRQFQIIKDTQKKIVELSQENRNLKAELLSSNFSKNGEALAEENYEKVGKIHYIKILNDTSIAKKTQP